MWPFGPRLEKPASSPAALGRRGETLAARYLKRAGMKILARNYAADVGEIDLIALDRKTRPPTIVFAEVKTRRTEESVSPASAVNAGKQGKLRATARRYLATHPAGDLPARFDVIAVVLTPGRVADITHLPDAF